MESPKAPKETTAEETGNGISASMFNIQIENPHEHVDDGKTVAAVGVGEVKPVTPSMVGDQPEEVSLSSLVFDKHNKKWNPSPSDESSNQIHVIVKPQL